MKYSKQIVFHIAAVAASVLYAVPAFSDDIKYAHTMLETQFSLKGLGIAAGLVIGFILIFYLLKRLGMYENPMIKVAALALGSVFGSVVMGSMFCWHYVIIIYGGWAGVAFAVFLIFVFDDSISSSSSSSGGSSSGSSRGFSSGGGYSSSGGGYSGGGGSFGGGGASGKW